MATKEQYKKAQAAFRYMTAKYGEPYDMTGGYSDGDAYVELLQSPSISTAYNHYVNIIRYGFQAADDYMWVIDGRKESITVDISEDSTACDIYDSYV